MKWDRTLTRFDCIEWSFEMIVWNDHLMKRWNDHLLKFRRRVLMLIDCFYLWGGFSLKLHVLRTIWRWFDWNADDWFLFLKKLDQMNVYESRSTVFDDVGKWSNECDVRMLHLMSMSSDALAVVWLPDGCIWCWFHQMFWRLSDCPLSSWDRRAVEMTQTKRQDDARFQITISNRSRDSKFVADHLKWFFSCNALNRVFAIVIFDFFFHSYVTLFEKITKFLSLTIADEFEIAFGVVFEFFFIWWSQLIEREFRSFSNFNCESNVTWNTRSIVVWFEHFWWRRRNVRCLLFDCKTDKFLTHIFKQICRYRF